MRKLRELLVKFKSLNINEIMRTILSDSAVQERIVEYNLQQLSEGRDIEGRSLSSANPYTERYAKLKGQTLVDLRRGGQFYSTFRVRVLDDGFRVEADTTIYKVDFEELYGRILGLDDRNLTRFEEFIKPYIIEGIKKHLWT